MMKRLLSVVALCLWCVSTSALWADGEKPKHTCKFYINHHVISTEIYAEGEELYMPVDNPGDINVNDNLELVGWLKNRNMKDSMLLNPPAGMVTRATMGTEDVEYYAVFAEPLVYRLSASMIENLVDRVWEAAEEDRYTPFQIGGTVYWKFRGWKQADPYGNDKFMIAKNRSINNVSYPSYIGFAAPKPIQKVTVGALYLENEGTLKHVYPGHLFIRTGVGVTDNQIEKANLSSSIVEFDLSGRKDTLLYLQAGDGTNSKIDYTARIYAVKLECGLGAYRTLMDSYELTIGASGYGTLCLPYSTAVPSGAKAYRLKEVDLDANPSLLKFAEVSALAANQGYLIKAKPDTTYTFYRVYNDIEDADSTNLMLGTVKEARWDTIIKVSGLQPFILSNGCFKQYIGDFIPAYKAFIAVNPENIHYPAQNNNAAELRVVLEDKEEMVTSEITECIEQIDDAPEVVYDLSGRQMPFIKRRGLYIVNGKTVLVK